MCRWTSGWAVALIGRTCLDLPRYQFEVCTSGRSCPCFGGLLPPVCQETAGVHRFAFHRFPFLQWLACTCYCWNKNLFCTPQSRNLPKTCLQQESCWERTFWRVSFFKKQRSVLCKLTYLAKQSLYNQRVSLQPHDTLTNEIWKWPWDAGSSPSRGRIDTWFEVSDVVNSDT